MNNTPNRWQPGNYQPQPGDNRIPYGYQPQQQAQPVYQPAYQQQPVYQQPQQQPVSRSRSALSCPRCGGQNISIQVVQTRAKTRTKGNGILHWFGRSMLIICTAGLWLLVAKRKSVSKTKITNEKLAVCQACGHSWTV